MVVTIYLSQFFCTNFLIAKYTAYQLLKKRCFSRFLPKLKFHSEQEII